MNYAKQLLKIMVIIMPLILSSITGNGYTYDGIKIKFITDGTTNDDLYYFMIIDTTESGDLRGFISGRFASDAQGNVALEVYEEVTQTSNYNTFGFPSLDSADYLLIALHSPDSYYAYSKLFIEFWDDGYKYTWSDNFGLYNSNLFWIVLEIDFSHNEGTKQKAILDRGRTLGNNYLVEYSPLETQYLTQIRLEKCSVFDDMLNALIHGSFQNFETINSLDIPAPSNNWVPV